VVVINETLARRYYGTTNAVGRQFKWGPRSSPDPWRRIIGVVGDVKQQSLDEEPTPSVYIPLLQMLDTGINVSMYRGLWYVARTSAPPAQIARSIRSTVRTFDSRLAVLNLQPVAELVGESTNERRFNAMLLGLFAALALALAATGVYGVLQYSVVQRTREIGIRIAVGARTANIIRLIVGHAVGLAVVGIALGLAGAFALTRVIRALLFNTSPFDPVTFAGSAAVLLFIVALSSYLPARRALRIDPSLAMRNE
jgi:ABC-type antimicrobial peptide transport system permease subunit